MSADRRGPDREPWAIGFGTLATYVGCLLAAGLFAGLLWLWLRFVVPAETFTQAGTRERIVVVFGVVAALLLVLLGPLVAWVVARALRRVRSTAVHVIAFTFTGSVVGGLLGSAFGPDVAASLVVTVGLAAGLARLLMRPFERRSRGA